jgi:hypothetical protein
MKRTLSIALTDQYITGLWYGIATGFTESPSNQITLTKAPSFHICIGLLDEPRSFPSSSNKPASV